MTKKIDVIQLVRDFESGEKYAEIALRQKVNIGSVAYWVKKLGLERCGQRVHVLSAEEKYIISKMIETPGGRRQLLHILRGR